MLVDPRVVDLSTLESHILTSTADSISRGMSESSHTSSDERLGAQVVSALANSTVQATTGLFNSRKADKSSAVLADSNLRNVVSDTNMLKSAPSIQTARVVWPVAAATADTRD